MMVLNSLIEQRNINRKSLSVLIDPDKIHQFSFLDRIIHLGSEIDYFLVGGSLLVSNKLDEIVLYIKENSNIPVVLFPGSNLHISQEADAILFLSLISGRNPDLLIGQHVAAAPVLKRSALEVLPTGYILVGNNLETTVAYISQTAPIPSRKPEIAACTAMAGEMLGLKLIYLDAGSGAKEEVPSGMILEVRESIDIPLIVGGGIDTKDKAQIAYQSGADMLVLGTSIERNVDFINEVLEVRDQFND